MAVPPGLADPSSRTHRGDAAGRRVASAEPTEATAAIGPWRLTALIHRGQRLNLYRARPIENQLGPGCYVLKTPCDGRSGNELALALLRREAAVAAAVSHPNLAAALGADWYSPSPVLLLPYLEGVSLRRLLASQLPPSRFALWIARQLAAALAALHSAGWLHGQLRPEHVIISPQGQATLIDLSQARRLETAEVIAESPEAALAYASPESFGRRVSLTAASDIYSLGALLFEMLAGRPPFAAADERAWANCHRRQKPPDLRSANPAVSRESAELVARMLAKEPLRRPTTSELIDRLAGLEIDELL